MTNLESKYRGALRWYPARWRRANGEALIGLMMDRAEAASREAPARGELFDLARHGLRLRIVAAAPWLLISAATLALAMLASIVSQGPFETVAIMPPWPRGNGVVEQSFVLMAPAWQFALAVGAFAATFGGAGAGLLLRRRTGTSRKT